MSEKRVPLKYEGEIVGWAEVENGRIVTGTITNRAFARFLNEDTLQYLSISAEDKNED